jgi:circadian clock protein KaiC
VAGSAETHLLRIKAAAAEIKAKCVVIDPLSALSKGGNESVAHNVAERLVDWTKSSGLTMLCTSLLDESGGEVEGTPLQISTIADTWIHLSYLVNGGERNRGLSIIKSRGTAHSNQVRELVLSSRGLGLTDVYTAGGEVLAGTLRWEKERAEKAEREESQTASESEQNALEIEALELEARLKVMKLQLEAKRVQKKMLARQAAERNAETTLARNRLRELRGVVRK